MIKEITAIITEDEKPARNLIKKFLESYNHIKIIAECKDGFEAVKKINQLKPDLLFLDIKMPKLNGFELLEILEHIPVIIFSTAYDSYALKAFEVNAADYLLKPYSQKRFDEALQKSFSKLEQSNLERKSFIEKISSYNSDDEKKLTRIVIKENQEINIIPTETIFLLEAQADYVKIFSGKGNFLKQQTMKYFEEHLEKSEFLRIHRSYIINIYKIERIELYDKESKIIIMKNGSKVKASKNGYAALKKMLE